MLTAEAPSLAEVALQFRLVVPSGRLARALAVLAGAKVSLAGIAAVQDGDQVRMTFVPEDAALTRLRLGGEGWAPEETKVFRLRLGSDGLQRLADALSARGFTIVSCYGRERAGAMDLIVETDRPDEAAALLARLG